MTKEQIFEFIKEQKTAMISSVDEEGFPNTKAMLSPRKIDGNDFYFTTNTSSLRVAQYRANEKACIYFYKRGRFKYTGVMLVGTMQVLTEQSIKDEIWRDGDTLFYKGGKTDPDYCVLRFTAESGRYYCDLKTEKFAFKQAIYDENYLAMLTAYGAYKDNLPTGIIATREGGITYLPMKYKYQEFKL